jgi:hypothetical protein
MAALVLSCGEGTPRHFTDHFDTELVKNGFGRYLELRIPASSKFHKELSGRKELRLQVGIPREMDPNQPINHQVEALRECSLSIARFVGQFSRPFCGDVYFIFVESRVFHLKDCAPKRSITAFMSDSTALMVDVDARVHWYVTVDEYREMVNDHRRSDSQKLRDDNGRLRDLFFRFPCVDFKLKQSTIHPEGAPALPSVTLI